MHALRYFFSEAAASLWRGRGAALLAILTIAAGLFVLGFFLLVNVNLQHVLQRWSESAELSIYLADDITREQLRSVEELTARSGLVASHTYVSKPQALERFRRDFPDMAPTASSLGSNPFPASLELQLRPDRREATGAIDGLVTSARQMAGVSDVRYDREWLARLNGIVRGARVAGLLIVLMLTVAAAMTVANVVRLAAAARRDEIEIMQLVGAPFTYVRGPFIAEGILQGGLGAGIALAGLAALFLVLRNRYGQAVADALGTAQITFLPLPLVGVVIVGGMLLGCIGGYVVARRVR